MAPESIIEHFNSIVDPRNFNKRHKLIDIVFITICVLICKAEKWEDIEIFGISKEKWLRTYLVPARKGGIWATRKVQLYVFYAVSAINTCWKWTFSSSLYLELPHGIPSHDTFARVFALMDPMEFNKCFQNWINSLKPIEKDEVLNIDGKTIRHSFDTANEKSAIHMVSAWANKAGITLGQVKVDEKSNEITAIPE